MTVSKELSKLGVEPVEGQNFLSNENIVEALVSSGEVESQKVLEIGSGTGTVTQKLSKKAEKVYAVEKDTTLAVNLEKKFEDRNVEVLNQDIMDYDWPEIDRCVANPPFFLSSEILEKLGEKQVQSSIIVQEEFADKIVADPGETEYGFSTVKAQYYFIPVKLRKVPKSCFYPSPDVDAAILKLYPNRERHGIKDKEIFFRITRALFNHGRKKLRNAFVDGRNLIGIEKEYAREIRDELPHSEQRVINLEISQIRDIMKFLSEKGI